MRKIIITILALFAYMIARGQEIEYENVLESKQTLFKAAHEFAINDSTFIMPIKNKENIDTISLELLDEGTVYFIGEEKEFLNFLRMISPQKKCKTNERPNIDIYYTDKIFFFKECDKYRLDNIYKTTNDTILFPCKENSTIDTVTLISSLRIDEYGSIMKDCILVGDKEIIEEYLTKKK